MIDHDPLNLLLLKRYLCRTTNLRYVPADNYSLIKFAPVYQEDRGDLVSHTGFWLR